jgi:cyclopropane-fatty-acyl-phospholipid synthase
MVGMTTQKEFLEEVFKSAGIQLNGNNPWDIQVLDSRFYERVLRDGTLGLGESYMSGWWKADDLDELAFRAVRARIYDRFRWNYRIIWHALRARLLNLQRRTLSAEAVKSHYDLSNTFYEYVLGETMAYTCAYWKDAKTLDEAQRDKFGLICRKLHLRPGELVLEHGCGWGGFAKYASKNYGCHATIVNISKAQISYVRHLCRDLDVEAHCCDYRDEHIYNPGDRKFDKVVSIGMCEHVGPKNYRRWFEIIERHLKDDGLFLLHTMGSDVSLTDNDRFTQKYIFKNSVMPSLKQLTAAAEGLFTIEDVQNFWKYYYYTMREWQRNFARNWDKIRELDL